MATTRLTLLLCTLLTLSASAQNLPQQWQLNDVDHKLTIGGVMNNGIFNDEEIKTMTLTFASSNWFTQLTQNYNSGTELSATLTFDGVTLNQVGVTFKGATSYMQTNGEEKKSFNIRTDAFIAGQNLEGYDVMNLNNCFDDATFLREFLYLKAIRNYVPAAQARFVKLIINNVSWGIYPMVQQLDGAYTGDWFLSNDGSRWRADAPSGSSGGGGGPNWGDGTAALNYLGANTSSYQQYYTLKNSGQANPWGDLMNVCDVLNNTSSANLITVLPQVMDVDRTLWFLACENVFADDDSYIMKGKMDYYLYIDAETNRITPLEYDGNSVLDQGALGWGPFYHADNANYPLLNKLLNVAEYRQRYLAHMRTIIQETVDVMLANQTIATCTDFIDAEVQADTKKLYTYAQFTSGTTTLNAYLQTRRNNLMNNSEVNQVGATIGNVTMQSSNGVWTDPTSGSDVTISAAIASPDGIHSVILYYSPALVGNFQTVLMTDDGTGADIALNDGIYTASIPAQNAGTIVRFYIEARENNTARTASFNPVGAEHDVYYYSVISSFAPSTDVVINELMASNGSTQTDEAGEYEDWIELYNRGTQIIDLSGYHITDNDFNLTKWEIPTGTLLAPNAYLIIWADEDSAQGPMHANFRLASAGEGVMLINADGQIADYIDFGAQSMDQGFARVPNGTGSFITQEPTFASNNNTILVETSTHAEVTLYPNPAVDVIRIDGLQQNAEVIIYELTGREVLRSAYRGGVNVSALSSGTYLVRINDSTHATVLMVKQ